MPHPICLHITQKHVYYTCIYIYIYMCMGQHSKHSKAFAFRAEKRSQSKCQPNLKQLCHIVSPKAPWQATVFALKLWYQRVNDLSMSRKAETSTSTALLAQPTVPTCWLQKYRGWNLEMKGVASPQQHEGLRGSPNHVLNIRPNISLALSFFKGHP